MKSEHKWLINPRIEKINEYSHNTTNIKNYIEEIYFYKYGECGIGCCYIKVKDIYDTHTPEVIVGRTENYMGGNKEDEEKIRPFLFDTEELAIEGAKKIIKNIIKEYKNRIENLNKMCEN